MCAGFVWFGSWLLFRMFVNQELVKVNVPTKRIGYIYSGQTLKYWLHNSGQTLKYWLHIIVKHWNIGYI